METLSVLHSFGYDCNKYFNLCVMDEHTLLYCSGNFIHMFDTRTKDIKLRKSEGACGLGHAVKNPKHSHLAVGEKGDAPPILIYCWPTFEMISVLRGGTSRAFVHLAYSPDGEMLCSQGGSPDYLLTLWDWAKGRIIVRTAAYETYNVEFSRYKSEHLASCGVGHIKLWQMSKTYTGLKLRSVQGKFGTTEVCNVVSLYSMPDLKVLSGCSWGNILVWDNGAILLEITQQGGRPCHDAPVSQIEYNQEYNEFITIGMDGWIKQWSYKAIENYNPMEGNGKIIMKPFFEICVKDSQGTAKLLSMVKKNTDSNNYVWFAQDGNGGLWEVDIEVSATAAPPKRLYSCHSAAVTALVHSPLGQHIASLSQRGILHVYNTKTMKVEAFVNFNCGGSAMIWLPFNFVPQNSVIIAGCDDGTLRVCLLHITKTLTNNSIKVIQIIKPYKMSVTAITVHESKRQLICGSEDGICFIFKFNNKFLEAIGFIQLRGEVVNFNWNMSNEDRLLIVCKELIHEIAITNDIQPAGSSYKLDIPVKSIQISTVIGIGQYTLSGSVWVSSVDQLLEYSFETGKFLRKISVEEEICSFISTKSGQFKILGFKNGTVRLVKSNCNDFFDFTDSCQLSVHDGAIPCLCLSADERYLFSCGNDGNTFQYALDILHETYKDTIEDTLDIQVSENVVECNEIPAISLEEEKENSKQIKKLEAAIQRKTQVQNKIKQLKEKFQNLVQRNSLLPLSQRLKHSDFKLDDRIKWNIQNLIQKEMDLIRRMMSFDLEKSQLRLQKLKKYFIDPLAAFSVEISAIRQKRTVSTFTHKALGEEFEDSEKETKELVGKYKTRIYSDMIEPSVKAVESTLAGEIPEPINLCTLDPLLQSTQDIYHKLNIKTRRALEKYKISKKKKEERKRQWETFMKTKPNCEENLPSDMLAMEKAQKTIGVYKLKSSSDYKVTDVFSLSSLHKFNQLISTKREIFTMKEDFNKKVYELRNGKVELVKIFKQLKYDLETMQREIPPEKIKTPPPVPQLNISREFPERKFQINPGKVPGTDLHLVMENDEEYDVLFTGRSNESDDETPEEGQLKTMRVYRKLFEQDEVILKMNTVVEQFDKRVDKLYREKLDVSINIKYLEIFLLEVQQELVVIQSFDEIEKNISEKVESSLAEKHTKLLKINVLQHKISAKTQDIRQLEQRIFELEIKFKALVAGNEAEKYLTKIYKKKYKIPLLNPQSDTEISDSSTSEDSSECSEDEAIKRKVRLSIVSAQDDESKILYNQTTDLRRQRHGIEAEIVKLQKVVERLKREENNHNKTIRLIEPVLRINQEQFETIQKEKHKKINEMDVLVVLNCSQLQNFTKHRCFESINHTLLISTGKLQGLQNRVTQLDKETEVISTKLRKNKKYQTRINEECRSLDSKITALKKEIQQIMVRKFAQEVDIDRLEESILINIINKVKCDLQEERLKRDFENQISSLKSLALIKSEELADLKRQNTEKLQTLSALQEEKEFLSKFLQQTEVQKVKLINNNTEEEYKKDIQKLYQVLKSLYSQKETLIHEIKVLSLKGRPLPPISESSRKSIPSLSLGEEASKSISNICNQ